MARKTIVNTSNTITVWKNKTNQMAEYLGDLDSINTPPINSDSNATAAINDLYLQAETVLLGFTGQAPITITANLRADSAEFDQVHVSSLFNFDSAMPDSNYFGDSTGTGDHDFVADSAGFGYLYAKHIDSYPDSAIINKVHIRDSARIQSITTDSNGILTFGSLNIIDKDFKLDSAQVFGTIRTRELFVFDSFGDSSGLHTDKATITTLTVDDMLIDSINIVTVNPFFITDSIGDASRDSCTVYFAAYLLDSG